MDLIEQKKKRVNEKKIKEEEFKKRIEYLDNLYQKNLEEKEKEFKKKGEIQKKNLETIRRNIYVKTMEKKINTEDKIQKVLNINDNIQKERLEEYIKKQKNFEIIRKKLAEEKAQKSRIKKYRRIEKENEIIQVLKKNEEINNQKMKEYNLKQEKLKKRQEINEEQKRRKIKIMHILLSEKQKNCFEARLKREKNIEKYYIGILDKIKLNNQKILKQKEKN